MDTEFLVQMRQSNKRGSARNDEIFNLHLGSGAERLLEVNQEWENHYLYKRQNIIFRVLYTFY